jgi:hypothetical protein
MNPLTDKDAFDYVDRMEKFREINKKFEALKRRERQRFYLRTLASVIGAVFFIWLFSQCTIAPKGVPPPKTASEWAKKNVIGYDSTGIKVTADWVRVYHSMIVAYGKKLPINEQVAADDMNGITPAGNNFHVSFETNKRFTDLKQIENEAVP